MANPEISIIITSYNIERYIKDAITSALSQANISLEIIAIDDASTDNTWNHINAITDPRLKTIRLTNNAGPSAARNAGITEAKGEWIAILDGDDQFLPNRLADMLKTAREKNADIIIDNLTIYREADGKEYPMFPQKTFNQIQWLDLQTFIQGNRLFSGNYALGYVKPIFSKNFLHQHNLVYDPEIHIGEDYHLLAACLACGARCAVISSAGYRYTVRKNSISHRLKLEDIERMRNCDTKLLNQYQFSPAALNAQKRREAGFDRASAYTKLITALKQKNIKAALKAIISYPSALLLLWMPIKVRLIKIGKKCIP